MRHVDDGTHAQPVAGKEALGVRLGRECDQNRAAGGVHAAAAACVVCNAAVVAQDGVEIRELRA
jgi:hypothetical protein